MPVGEPSYGPQRVEELRTALAEIGEEIRAADHALAVEGIYCKPFRPLAQRIRELAARDVVAHIEDAEHLREALRHLEQAWREGASASLMGALAAAALHKSTR